MFDGMDMIQELHLEDLLTSGHSPEGVTIASAQISDPYVLLNLSSGVSIVLRGDPDSMTLEPLQVWKMWMCVRLHIHSSQMC